MANWANLASSWTPCKCQKHRKTYFVCFCYCTASRLKMPKMAQRWPQECPRRPQDGPKSRQVGPKTAPRRVQDGLKTALWWLKFAKLPPSCLQVAILPAMLRQAASKLPPRWHQEAPRGPQKVSKRPPTSTKSPPRGLQEAPKSSQEAPKEPPRGPQEALKRPPQGPQDAPKMHPSTTFRLHFQAFHRLAAPTAECIKRGRRSFAAGVLDKDSPS